MPLAGTNCVHPDLMPRIHIDHPYHSCRVSYSPTIDANACENESGQFTDLAAFKPAGKGQGVESKLLERAFYAFPAGPIVTHPACVFSSDLSYFHFQSHRRAGYRM
jgi:hypothetical protein